MAGNFKPAFTGLGTVCLIQVTLQRFILTI